jgi:hypothetical protein
MYLNPNLQLHHGIQPVWNMHLKNKLILNSVTSDTISLKWQSVTQMHVIGAWRGQDWASPTLG